MEPTTNNPGHGLAIERERGLPIRIQCISEEEEENIPTLTLLFQYEFAVLDPRESIAGEVIFQDLPSLEYFILHHVAREIGLLDDCNVTTSVVGLANLQADEWERNIECTELTNLPIDLICIPLLGIMQASYIPSDNTTERDVETMLTSTISNVLNGDEIRKQQGIESTIFIGSRVIADSNTAADGPQWLPAVLATSLSAVLVFGGLGMFLLHRTRQRRKKQQNQTSEIIPDLPLQKVVTPPEDTENSESKPHDVEVPSVDPLVLSIATTRTASETIVDTDESLKDGSLNSRATPVVPQTLTNPMDPTTNPPSVINLQPRPKAADGTALIRPPPPKPPLPAGKPPASPRGTAAIASSQNALTTSKPLKQRRRKKRKKKPKVVRVNSRERINEMETIKEIAEEEGSSDSEYSWYSETDSNASSRDVSPTRGCSPSTMNSEEMMAQLRQSLDSPSQLLSVSSSKEEDSVEGGEASGVPETDEATKEVVVSSSSSNDSSAEGGEVPTKPSSSNDSDTTEGEMPTKASSSNDSNTTDGEIPTNATAPR